MLYHYIEIIRDPLMGQPPSAWSWFMARAGRSLLAGLLPCCCTHDFAAALRIGFDDRKAIGMTSITLEKRYDRFSGLWICSAACARRLFGRVIGGIDQAEANKHIVVRALNNINLQLRDGDRLGLMGHNGQARLRCCALLAGIYTPTEGLIHIKGRSHALKYCARSRRRLTPDMKTSTRAAAFLA